MKKLFGICRNILAAVGGIAILLVVLYFCTKPYFEVDVYPSRLAQMDRYLDSLRTSGPYAPDTASFSIRIIQDTVRAKEIKDYFQLDTLYAPDADTWTKALAIGRFVASNIPHGETKGWPEEVDAIGLWEYSRNVSPAFNCRLHAIMTFELLLAAGLDAKYITCMPADPDDNDCHVVDEVWLPELGKWAMIDTDFGGYYFSDMKGTPLSLREMREHYISGGKMMYYPAYEKGKTRRNWYYAYMAKNARWYSCWGELSYYQEDYDHGDVIRDHYINLFPSGVKATSNDDLNIITTDADRFWAPPVH